MLNRLREAGFEIGFAAGALALHQQPRLRAEIEEIVFEDDFVRSRDLGLKMVYYGARLDEQEAKSTRLTPEFFAGHRKSVSRVLRMRVVKRLEEKGVPRFVGWFLVGILGEKEKK